MPTRTRQRRLLQPARRSNRLPVAGAALWLDGSDFSSILTDNGQSVYQWSDKSGNARHAVQPSIGVRPTWVAPGNGLSGLSGIAFNGSNQRMTLSLPSLANGYAIYAAVKNPTGSGTILCTVGAGVNNAIATVYSTVTQLGISQWGAFTASNVSAGINVGFVGKYDGSHPTGGYTIRTSNQAADVTGTMGQTAGYPAAGIGALGSDTNATPTQYANPTIFELVLLDRVSTAAEDLAMKSYFATKWGITWS